MGHVVLLGDSIFDNARYVPDRPPVIEQVRHDLPAGWKATLLAVDGNITEDVATQMNRLPPDATHLFVSVGGNDALGESGILDQPTNSVRGALEQLQGIGEAFQTRYQDMLRAVLAPGKPVTVCTIYDAIPGLEPADRTALALFNDVILRLAFGAGVAVIDLRLVCDKADDYSPVSPIEPSVIGGAKIARVIADVATKHDVGRQRSCVYW
jgi:hypothetical protein